MKIYILFFALAALLTSCYRANPADGEVCTVPVTNNPNAMPGPMKQSSLPSIY